MKQVDRSHYEFGSYMSKGRWNSVWHQLEETMSLNPRSVLEVGPGPGTFKSIGKSFGLDIKTFDLDPDLEPDFVGSATSMPLSDDQFDIVCAFQVLEHLPYEDALLAFAEMARVSNSHIILSLPDAKPVWRYRIFVPKFGNIDRLIARPFWKPVEHKFDGQHYWEVNKLGYDLDKIQRDFSAYGKLIKSYRVAENPYHRFFVFQIK